MAGIPGSVVQEVNFSCRTARIDYARAVIFQMFAFPARDFKIGLQVLIGKQSIVQSLPRPASCASVRNHGRDELYKHLPEIQSPPPRPRPSSMRCRTFTVTQRNESYRQHTISSRQYASCLIINPECVGHFTSFVARPIPAAISHKVTILFLSIRCVKIKTRATYLVCRAARSGQYHLERRLEGQRRFSAEMDFVKQSLTPFPSNPPWPPRNSFSVRRVPWNKKIKKILPAIAA